MNDEQKEQKEALREKVADTLLSGAFGEAADLAREDFFISINCGGLTVGGAGFRTGHDKEAMRVSYHFAQALREHKGDCYFEEFRSTGSLYADDISEIDEAVDRIRESKGLSGPN